MVYPFPTTDLVSVPTGSALLPGTNLLVVAPSGRVEQTPLSLLPSAEIYINVKAQSAIGDGVVDDRSAIQSAIRTCSSLGGGTVFLPRGIYYISGALVLPTSVRLLGDSATIKSRVESEGAKVVVVGSWACVENLTFEGARLNGSPSFAFGLIDITCGTTAGIEGVRVTGCRIQNSQNIGLRVLGNVNALTIENNTFTANFIHVFAEKYGGFIYHDLSIEGNRFGATWYTGSYSGAIKLKGDGGAGLNPSGVRIGDNRITGSGEMGVELFDGLIDCLVTDNIISACVFGVSLDNGTEITIAKNKISACSYTGIELADRTSNCLVSGNSINCYSATGFRAGSSGIVSSGATCDLNRIENNTVRGCAGSAIHIQGNTRVGIRGNRLHDSVILANVKDTDYAVLGGNELYGPCNYHVFIDCNDRNCTDLFVENNYFYGRAEFDNVIIYSGLPGRLVTNLGVRGNNAAAATCANLPVNNQVPQEQCPNMQVYGNYFVPGPLKTAFADVANAPQLALPYSSPIQRAGLSVAAKRVLSVPSSASARWVKVLSNQYGFPFYLKLHVVAFTPDGSAAEVKNAITAEIVGAPYGFDGGVTLYPSGNYRSGLIDEVIYDNPTATGGGALHEVWLKIRPIPTTATIEFYFSDYAPAVLLAPVLTAVSPIWSANSYRAQIETSSNSFQAPGLWARNFISSAPKGALAAQGGRLHIRGDFNSVGRIARFDLDDGTEAVGIDAAGLLRVKKISVGGGYGLNAIVTGTGSLDFGTVLANAEAAINLYVGGALAGNNPAVAISLKPSLPGGVVFKQAFVTATNLVSVILRNTTGADVYVGPVTTTATVFQF